MAATAETAKVPHWLQTPKDLKTPISSYEQPPPEIPAEPLRLLEKYGKIAPEKALDYVVSFRDRFWEIQPLPCVGQFKFIQSSITRQPEVYQRILEMIKDGGRYLDIGCAVGQDMRTLVLDGCPSDNMFAIELSRGFIDLAYEFWNDRDTLKTKFIIGDFRDTKLEEAQSLLGTVDVVYAGIFLHLFSLADQMVACIRMTEFLKPVSGVTLAGSSIGRMEPGTWTGPNGDDLYKHNSASFKAMWEEVSRRTGVEWKVNCFHTPMQSLNGALGHWHDPLTAVVYWEVQRV